jgi:hypothetical protein
VSDELGEGGGEAVNDKVDVTEAASDNTAPDSAAEGAGGEGPNEGGQESAPESVNDKVDVTETADDEVVPAAGEGDAGGEAPNEGDQSDAPSKGSQERKDDSPEVTDRTLTLAVNALSVALFWYGFSLDIEIAHMNSGPHHVFTVQRLHELESGGTAELAGDPGPSMSSASSQEFEQGRQEWKSMEDLYKQRKANEEAERRLKGGSSFRRPKPEDPADGRPKPGIYGKGPEPGH